MVEADVPSLADWAGGPDAFRRLTAIFYRNVARDPLLGPVFGDMNPSHAEHVAAFVTEVMGGPKAWSATGGSHASMIARHLGRHLTEPQRRRWLDLMLDALDEARLPDDPEFRSALVGYFEWGTRLAVINSQDGAKPPGPESSMPSWNWGAPGGPWRG